MGNLKLKFREVVDEGDIKTMEDLLPCLKMILRSCVELAIADELAENGEKETGISDGGQLGLTSFNAPPLSGGEIEKDN